MKAEPVAIGERDGVALTRTDEPNGFVRYTFVGMCPVHGAMTSESSPCPQCAIWGADRFNWDACKHPIMKPSLGEEF